MEKKQAEKKVEQKEELKELTKEEKEILKRLEKGEVEEVTGGKEIKQDPKYEIYSKMMYEVHPTKGLIYRNTEVISNQRKVIFYLLKNAGANLLHGKSIMNTSLPVKIFAPYSLLEKSAESYVFAPLFMERMYAAPDPIEKMKHAIGFVVASLHRNLEQTKPFNPILGETYQAKIGNLNIYCEQTFHHPPISQVYAVADHYTISTKHEFSMNAYPNSASFKVLGKRIIRFNDSDHTTYSIEFPKTEVSGSMFGTRILQYSGVLTLKDKTHKLYGQLRFMIGEKKFTEGLFKKQTERSDFFKGFITTNKALLRDNSRTAFYSKDMLSYVEGNWIDHVMIDGDNYWELNREVADRMEPFPNLLPSDSSFRDDLIEFRRGDLEASQKQKEIMEEIQRNDRKLRSTPSVQ